MLDEIHYECPPVIKHGMCCLLGRTSTSQVIVKFQTASTALLNRSFLSALSSVPTSELRSVMSQSDSSSFHTFVVIAEVLEDLSRCWHRRMLVTLVRTLISRSAWYVPKFQRLFHFCFSLASPLASAKHIAPPYREPHKVLRLQLSCLTIGFALMTHAIRFVAS